MLGILKKAGIFFDSYPKEGSENAVTSDGVYKAIQAGGGGTSDYAQLTNKPSIAGVELVGNKTLEQFGISSQADLAALSSRVGNVEGDIGAVETALTSKASQADLAALSSRVGNVEGDIGAVETALTSKASQADLDALSSRVGNVEGDIGAVETALTSKASQADLDALETALTKLNIVTTGIATNGSGVSGTIRWTKIGRVVTISSDMLTQQQKGTGEIVATGFPKPKSQTRGTFSLLNTSQSGDFVLSTSGNLQVGQSTSPYLAGYWAGSFAYIADE